MNVNQVIRNTEPETMAQVLQGVPGYVYEPKKLVDILQDLPDEFEMYDGTSPLNPSLPVRTVKEIRERVARLPAEVQDMFVSMGRSAPGNTSPGLLIISRYIEPNHHMRDELCERNGRWGSCGACPIDSVGMIHPEDCENKDRYDHNIAIPWGVLLFTSMSTWG